MNSMELLLQALTPPTGSTTPGRATAVRAAPPTGVPARSTQGRAALPTSTRTAPGGPCNEYSGIGSGQRACSGCQTAFHTYRMEYDRSVSPEQIRWYLDGVNFFTVYSNQVDPTTWNNALHHGFFVIFDLAMGGGFPNALAGGSTPTASTASGVPMLVDYVRVYTSHHETS